MKERYLFAHLFPEKKELHISFLVCVCDIYSGIKAWELPFIMANLHPCGQRLQFIRLSQKEKWSQATMWQVLTSHQIWKKKIMEKYNIRKLLLSFKKKKKIYVYRIMGMLSLVGKAKATLEVSPKLHRLINKTNTKN